MRDAAPRRATHADAAGSRPATGWTSDGGEQRGRRPDGSLEREQGGAARSDDVRRAPGRAEAPRCESPLRAARRAIARDDPVLAREPAEREERDEQRHREQEQQAGRGVREHDQRRARRDPRSRLQSHRSGSYRAATIRPRHAVGTLAAAMQGREVGASPTRSSPL
jgi:hypothetical protein